jgi:hypothetical protein
LSLAELVLALPPALSPIELDLLLVVVLRLLATPKSKVPIYKPPTNSTLTPKT